MYTNFGVAFAVEDVVIKRFKNVQKKILIFENKKVYKDAIKLKSNIVTKYERYINENQNEFLDNWNKI